MGKHTKKISGRRSQLKKRGSKKGMVGMRSLLRLGLVVVSTPLRNKVGHMVEWRRDYFIALKKDWPKIRGANKDYRLITRLGNVHCFFDEMRKELWIVKKKLHDSTVEVPRFKIDFKVRYSISRSGAFEIYKDERRF